MATLLNSFGCKVYLARKPGGSCPGRTGIPASALPRPREQGVEIIPRAKLAFVRKSETGYTCILDDPDERTVEVEKVLISGRKPNTQHMGLDQVEYL